jgi:pimeloyl-ACP methyl ester carboxylesterase
MLRHSLAVAYREALRTPAICWSALRGFRDCVDPGYRASNEPVLILGGFLSHPYYYTPLGRLLRSLGHTVHFDTTFNARAFRTHVAELAARVDAIADAAGAPVRILGHSLGGAHGIALLDVRPETVAHTIAIASPIHGGTPWRALQRLADRVLRISQQEALALRTRLPALASRITTVAATHDPIAPPAACAIEGATNHVLDTVAAEDRSVASHGGLVFMRACLRLVLASLAEPVLAADPVRASA